MIVPLFALANAGVALSARAARRAASPVAVGVVVGLVVGKLVGITAFTWLAHAASGVPLPAEVRWGHVVGIAAVAGIGFTVSLFITGLAYTEQSFQVEAKTAVLAASVVAGLRARRSSTAMSSRHRTAQTSIGANGT